LIVHACAGVAFAACYLLAMQKLGLTAFPAAVGVGLLLGFLHGSVVCLALVWMVSDEHPLPEFREASFAVGLTHLAGHLAYGAVVGLVVGLTR